MGMVQRAEAHSTVMAPGKQGKLGGLRRRTIGTNGITRVRVRQSVAYFSRSLKDITASGVLLGHGQAQGKVVARPLFPYYVKARQQ